MTVLDASAVLAVIHGERGAGLVEDNIMGATLGAANLAEVAGKLVDAGSDSRHLRPLLSAAGVRIEPVTSDDADLAGALRGVDRGRELSLGDRCCLALTARSDPPDVLTADRLWSELDLPLTVRLIR